MFSLVIFGVTLLAGSLYTVVNSSALLLGYLVALFTLCGLFVLVTVPEWVFHVLTHDGNVSAPLVWTWAKLPTWVRDFIREYVLRANSLQFTVGVGAIIKENGNHKYLLVQHKYPLGGPQEKWGLPGGGVHESNIPKALEREIRQELGIEISVGRLLVMDESQSPRLDLFYECDIVNGTKPLPRVDVSEIGYFSIAEFPEGAYPRHVNALKAAIKIANGRRNDNIPLPVYIPPPNNNTLDKQDVVLYKDSNGIESKSNSTSAIYFEFERTLEDIPEPSTCHFCGSPMQKEYLEYESIFGSVKVACDSPIPAYGCMNCGVKEEDSRTIVALLRVAAASARDAGLSYVAGLIEDEARWVEGKRPQPFEQEI